MTDANARNYRFFRDFARDLVEAKCYDCEKFTYYGKTCKGKCDKGED